MIKLLYFTLILALSGLPGAVNAADQTCKSKSEISASTPMENFTDHGNGTVTDTQTGLMWAKCAQGLSGSGCAMGSSIEYDWQAALNLANSSTLASHHDWRLPNVNELRSIVEGQCISPAINLSVFPNTPSSNFWSASPYAGSSSGAWSVNFNDGGSYYSGRSNPNRSDNKPVRLVRSGQ